MSRTSSIGRGGDPGGAATGGGGRFRCAAMYSTGTAPLERPASREDLVEDDAEAVDVAPPVERSALAERAELLRRPVGDFPEEEPGRRERFGRRRLEELRDAEVEELDGLLDAGLDDEDVVGREVAVDDPAGGEVFHAVGGLDQERQGLGEGVAGVAADRFPLEVLHRQVGRPVLLADLVERDDVGVEEPLEDVRLAREADARLGDVRRRLVARHLGLADDLQRDRLAVAFVDGAVDDPHTAAADAADDPVVRDPFDGRRAQVSSEGLSPPPRLTRTRPATLSAARSRRRRTQEDVRRVAGHEVDLRDERHEDAVAVHLPHDDARVDDLLEVERHQVVEELARDVVERLQRDVRDRERDERSRP